MHAFLWKEIQSSSFNETERSLICLLPPFPGLGLERYKIPNRCRHFTYPSRSTEKIMPFQEVPNALNIFPSISSSSSIPSRRFSHSLPFSTNIDPSLTPIIPPSGISCIVRSLYSSRLYTYVRASVREFWGTCLKSFQCSNRTCPNHAALSFRSV